MWRCLERYGEARVKYICRHFYPAQYSAIAFCSTGTLE
jgi:hypothetical protein